MFLSDKGCKASLSLALKLYFLFGVLIFITFFSALSLFLRSSLLSKLVSILSTFRKRFSDLYLPIVLTLCVGGLRFLHLFYQEYSFKAKGSKSKDFIPVSLVLIFS